MKRQSMGFIRYLVHNKFIILFSLFMYLLIWFIYATLKQLSNPIRYQTTFSPTDLYFVLERLSNFNINLLLIDPFLLDYLFIRHLPFRQFQKRAITFGIFNDSIPSIHHLFSMKNFTIETSESSQLDHIFIHYNQQIIHLAVLHKKHSYFRIEKNMVQLPMDVQLSYGDTVRVIDPIETAVMKGNFSFSFPRNVSHFLWLYNTSEFIECNQALANLMENKYGLYQNKSQLNLTIEPMRYIASTLNELEKRYWLAGGTLLGWYRHCGLIPYTQDVDFGLFAEEYDESIRNHFLGNPAIYLWGALGLVNDSLEFRLFTGQFTFDLFWAYRENDHRWCGYQMQRVKYRRLLPLLPQLCSCDLFGHRLSIPCSPVEYLNNEYGHDTWKNPLEKEYTWMNIKYNSIWNDISWMYATRLYTQKGKLRTDKYAIDWIRDQFDYSFKTVPSFLNILPDKPVTLPPLKIKLK